MRHDDSTRRHPDSPYAFQASPLSSLTAKPSSNRKNFWRGFRNDFGYDRLRRASLYNVEPKRF
ncbi:hypothetical protein M407DRAFT_245375 [Tulasnella calospora MUT 4182]|uniref:Uncharacterized protein n=1 Tax=Tulasnella calospora MUT 4182 TaxID=1051891 RepID=A0A0C3QBN0_9AGAM|nr:hypothetical protein M407DRAFT_245375 [Tulasnella calospora MUT 4182]